MNSPAPYIHWGFILLSVPNLVLIILMLALFAIALVAPFPTHHKPTSQEEEDKQR